MDSGAIFATSTNGFFNTNQLIISRNLTPKPHLLAPNVSTYVNMKKKKKNNNNNSPSITYAAALSETSTAISDPATVDITWQIVVGTLAGITPFTVAGIEFSKRIVKQRKCEVCNGSGLVMRADKNHVKCPACGGWLPWQSWRRFFLG